jgi:16S rRNA (cytosine967-C5)-methyltransferase
MYYDSYCNTAVRLIKAYDGKTPLPHFLKKFFSENKKFGSTDRKQISGLCYAYFRCGRALPELPTEERILTGVFLSGHTSGELLNHFKPEWNQHMHLPLKEKLSFVSSKFSIAEIFPWSNLLSGGIDHDAFCESFLTQPDLFIRIRPGHESVVKTKLTNANISFRMPNESCIAMQNTTKIDELINLDQEAVVQDYNSQMIRELFPDSLHQRSLKVWDCCAGSGGKSILAFDQNPLIDLTVSDIRKSILVNLKKRFVAAGIKKYRAFNADLTLAAGKLPLEKTDLIIADVPCSGSGTWSRTPESLSFFQKEDLEEFKTRQKKIVDHIIPFMKQNGTLVYITCSVFKTENEEMVDHIISTHSLKLQQSVILKGYDKKADTLFGARFTV